MIDQKIWLVYKPTGERICLMKNKGGGWYASAAATLRKLDKFLSVHSEPDDEADKFTLESD